MTSTWIVIDEEQNAKPEDLALTRVAGGSFMVIAGEAGTLDPYNGDDDPRNNDETPVHTPRRGGQSNPEPLTSNWVDGQDFEDRFTDEIDRRRGKAPGKPGLGE